MAKQAKTTSPSKGSLQKDASKQPAKSASAASTDNEQEQISDGTAQDALGLLKADHRKVEDLFAQFDGASDSEQKEVLAHQICHELMIHTLLEEEIFYPACRDKDVEDDMLDEAQVEHDGAKILITELLTLAPDSDYYDAKVKVLAEMIKHHVAEEEKDDGIFAKAQEAEIDMKEVGQQLQQRKQQLKDRVESGRLGLPRPRALFSLNKQSSYKENYAMPRMGGRERDDDGRFMSHDDDRRGGGNGGRGGRSTSQYRERDDNGRFMSDDNGWSGGGRSGSQYRERDEQGRFLSDDDQGGYSSRGSRGRYEDESDDRRGRYRGQSGQDYRERDEQGRFQSDDEQGGYSSRGSRGRYEEDDRRYSSRSSQSGGRYDNDDDDRRSSRSGGGRGQGHGGWFGDADGHSQAAQRGWQDRGSSRSVRGQDDDGDDRRSSNRSMRSRSDDDDDRRSSSGGGQGHGGWFGDSRGHSQAAKRGWQHRD